MHIYFNKFSANLAMSSNKCLVDTMPADFDIGLHCFHFCCIPTFPWSRREDYSSCIELHRSARWFTKDWRIALCKTRRRVV